jgi:predicted peptidase
MSRVTIFVFAILLAGCGPSAPSFTDAEFPARQVTVGNTVFGYRIHLPANNLSGGKLPVMLYLHGSGARGSDNVKQVESIASLIREHPERFPFIMVFPQCRDGKFWSGETNEMAIAALDQTVKEFNGDEQRLFLAGFSMGGNATWQNGLVHPGKFAALVPIAGEVAPQRKLSDDVLASLPPRLREAAVSPDPYSVFAKGIDAAVWAFHGSNDESVAVTESRRIMEAFKDIGKTDVRYTEYQDEGHLIDIKALGEPELSQWLADQRAK